MRIKAIIIWILIFASAGSLKAQTTVHFMADDGLMVTADQYLVHDSLPWILMFHQGGYSRGEFREIAPKLTILGYNCLAVDLRFGKEINLVVNETNIAARKGDYPFSMQDARRDILAAINWIAARSDSPVVLLGSSFSASLALILARNIHNAAAVIAFSPGEFFGHPDLVRNALRNLDVPVFLASTKREYPYVTELSSGISSEYKYIFTPSRHQGVHGAKALWDSEDGSEEYWPELLKFISRIKKLDIVQDFKYISKPD